MKKCKECKTEFEPYPVSDDCMMCHDGDYETDEGLYDGTTRIMCCPFCGGHGSIDDIEDKYCPNCRERINSGDYDEDY